MIGALPIQTRPPHARSSSCRRYNGHQSGSGRRVSSKEIRARRPDWEVIIARLRLFGFEVHDARRDNVRVARFGRKATVDLTDDINIDARDPRDAWVLKQILHPEEKWLARESYFVTRVGDAEVFPVELRLVLDDSGKLAFEHDFFDGRCDRALLASTKQLTDLLPYLAAPNTIGYHQARNRILRRHRELHPETFPLQEY